MIPFLSGANYTSSNKQDLLTIPLFVMYLARTFQNLRYDLPMAIYLDNVRTREAIKGDWSRFVYDSCVTSTQLSCKNYVKATERSSCLVKLF